MRNICSGDTITHTYPSLWRSIPATPTHSLSQHAARCSLHGTDISVAVAFIYLQPTLWRRRSSWNKYYWWFWWWCWCCCWCYLLRQLAARSLPRYSRISVSILAGVTVTVTAILYMMCASARALTASFCELEEVVIYGIMFLISSIVKN